MFDSFASQIAAGLLILVTGAALFSACNARSGRRPGDFDGQHARDLVAQGAPLLDVRSPAEFAGGHIQGAVNIPLSELDQRIEEVRTLSADGKSDALVVYCRSGNRSGQARKTLEARGFETVVNLGRADIWDAARSN